LSFELREAHARAAQRGVAVRLQKRGRLLHARLDANPVEFAAEVDARVARVQRRADLFVVDDIHDVGDRQRVGEILDLVAGCVTEVEPRERGRTRARRRRLRALRDVQRARGKIGLLVGDEHEDAAVGGVVAHHHGALVGEHLNQFVRDATEAIVLPDRAGAVGMHGHFGHMAVVVWARLRFVAVEILAVGLELRIRR
jgi:hypothetical protein